MKKKFQNRLTKMLKFAGSSTWPFTILPLKALNLRKWLPTCFHSCTLFAVIHFCTVMCRLKARFTIRLPQIAYKDTSRPLRLDFAGDSISFLSSFRLKCHYCINVLLLLNPVPFHEVVLTGLLNGTEESDSWLHRH